MTKIEAVDFTAFLPTESYVLDILSPAGKPTGWKWELAAVNHDKTVAFAEAEARRALDLAKAAREAQYNGRPLPSEERTPDQARRENMRWVVARVLSWTPVRIAGETFEFSDKATEDLLVRPEMGHVLTQITRALGDEARFTKG